MRSKKLFLVTCRDMHSSHITGNNRGIAYVVASSSTEAYAMLRQELDKLDAGFPRERELGTVQLLAENVEYPKCDCRLYL